MNAVADAALSVSSKMRYLDMSGSPAFYSG
jgi:hypothetical protein